MSWRAAWNTLMRLLVAHQRKEWGEIDACAECIDDDRFVRARHLGDAQLGIIGAFAQEFGVDGHEGMARHAARTPAQAPPWS